MAWQENSPYPDWDESQTKRNAHFLQSKAWGAFQIAQGKRIFYSKGQGWSWLAILESGKMGKFLYCPYGPTVATVKSLANALEALQECAKQNVVDFIRVEPQGKIAENDLKKAGLRRAHKDIQPQYTLVKNLDQSDEQLFAEMSSTNRRLYRRADKSGFTFKASYDPKDMQPFLDMLHEVAGRQSIVTHSDKYLTTMAETLMPLKAATLFYVLHNGQEVAACFTFESPTTRYYAHAASADSARKLQPGAPMMGHVIFDAKRSGKQYFDYFGIAPPGSGPEHKWAGFTRLKKSFGGEVKEMLGTWELPVNVAKYGAYRLLRRIKR